MCQYCLAYAIRSAWPVVSYVIHCEAHRLGASSYHPTSKARLVSARETELQSLRMACSTSMRATGVNRVCMPAVSSHLNQW